MTQILLKIVSISIACAVLCLPAMSWADGFESQPEMARRFSYNFHKQHDRGLYLRLGAGVGYLSSSITPPYEGETVEKSGVRFGYGAHLGGYVAPRWALHLSQWGQLGASRGSLGAGPGTTFYFKEAKNMFLSASLGGVTLYDSAPDLDFGTQWALGGELEAGLGTWVSPHASLGVSLVAGGHLLNLDQDMISGSGWHAGARLTWALH